MCYTFLWPDANLIACNNSHGFTLNARQTDKEMRWHFWSELWIKHPISVHDVLVMQVTILGTFVPVEFSADHILYQMDAANEGDTKHCIWISIAENRFDCVNWYGAIISVPNWLAKTLFGMQQRKQSICGWSGKPVHNGHHVTWCHLNRAHHITQWSVFRRCVWETEATTLPLSIRGICPRNLNDLGKKVKHTLMQWDASVLAFLFSHPLQSITQ